MSSAAARRHLVISSSSLGWQMSMRQQQKRRALAASSASAPVCPSCRARSNSARSSTTSSRGRVSSSAARVALGSLGRRALGFGVEKMVRGEKRFESLGVPWAMGGGGGTGEAKKEPGAWGPSLLTLCSMRLAIRNRRERKQERERGR
eukprot:scaffold226246_cov30-Tisochrysis_lutea.AAC.1